MHRLLNREHLNKAHAFFERYGGKAVVLGRFVPDRPDVRAVRRRRRAACRDPSFVFYNFTGAPSGSASVSAADCSSATFPIVKENFTLVTIGIVAVSLLPIVIEWLRHRRQPPQPARMRSRWVRRGFALAAFAFARTAAAAPQQPATPPPAQPAPAPAPPRVVAGQDGIAIESGDGEFRLQIGVLAHVDGRFTPGDENQQVIDTFAVRRLRPYFRGRLGRRFEFYVNPDFAGSTLVVQDAYIDTIFSPAFRLRAGKGKTPFGFERLHSASNMLFFERGSPTALAPNRDIGFQALGELYGGRVVYLAA